MRVSPSPLLLVEGDLLSASPRLGKTLGTAEDEEFRVRAVARLSEALGRVRHNAVAVVLLDLPLPDGRGVQVFDQVRAAAQDTGIVILTSPCDEKSGRQVVQRDTHDEIVKRRFSGNWVGRILRYMFKSDLSGALRSSEARLWVVGEHRAQDMGVSESQSHHVYTNRAGQDISGLASAQTINTHCHIALRPDDCQRVLARWRDAARGPDPCRFEYLYLRNDGSVVWARLNSGSDSDCVEVQDHDPTFDEITLGNRAPARAEDDSLFGEKERAQAALRLVTDAVLMTDLHGNLTFLNPVAQKMTGWPCEDAIGRPLAEVFHILEGNTRQLAVSLAQRAIDANATVHAQPACLQIRRDGFEYEIEHSAAPAHDRHGRVTGAVIAFHELVQSPETAHQMHHLAHHDPLTGLPNRTLLKERLSRAMALARRHGKKVGLMYIDLDHFKRVNDSKGHAIGDELLRSVAKHFSACVRDTDTVCRQGGDEFVILLTEIEQPGDAAHVADTLCASFAPPHIVADLELHVTFSIGISIYPDDAVDVDMLLKNADTAMYQVKANGRRHYQFYREDMQTAALRRRTLRDKLPAALRENEFVLHYQPRVDLDTGVISGLEALIRWRDPDLGIIYPQRFLPIAEECGLIVDIGVWVLRTACSQIQDWLDAGRAAVPISINISAAQFQHKDFQQSVAMVLRETGIAAQYLELEIPGDILWEDPDASVAVLEALRTQGVRISICGLGTGCDPGQSLKRFPIDILKIEPSLVRDLAIDTDDAENVKAVIAKGRDLRYDVVAQGIETRAQLTLLREWGCGSGQGFYFSRPLHADVCENLMGATCAPVLPVN